MTADPFHGVTKCHTVSKQTDADLQRRSEPCPTNLYGDHDDNSNNNDGTDYKLESRRDSQTAATWKGHHPGTRIVYGTMEHCVATCNMFPTHEFPAISVCAGLPSIALLAQLDNKGQFVQLPTYCRGLGNFGPDLPKIARDILHDPHNALGPVPCSALVYESFLTTDPNRVNESASVVYDYTTKKGEKCYCIASTPRRDSARTLFDLAEPTCQRGYQAPPRLGELNALTLISHALYCISVQPLVNFYTALQLCRQTKTIRTRQGGRWDKALQTNRKEYKNTIEDQQRLHRATINLLQLVQSIHISIGRGHGRFKLGLCAFTGTNTIVGEPPSLLRAATLAKLSRTLHGQASRTVLMTAPLDDDALWTAEKDPDTQHADDEWRALTPYVIELVNIMTTEEQLTLENPRMLPIPDRMRTAKNFAMFDVELPWTQENPRARDFLDNKYDRIAALCFSVGNDAWIGKFEEDPDKIVEGGNPDKPKRKKESTLTVHNIISMTRSKGLHLLNHHLMKQGAKQRPRLLQEIAPFHFQERWYTQAAKYCKSFLGGTKKQALAPHIVMQDCAVVAVYVTYVVGLWLMNGTANDWQTWNNLLLKWHLECLNTNTKAETSQATLPTEPSRPKKKKRAGPTNNTKQKKPAKPQKPNTTKQKLLHETVEVPNDATKPVKDIRLTVEELSCDFVVRLLKELWFPVCAVVEAIRNIPMRSGPDDNQDREDNLKHKHPWAEQIILARLVSHMITLRDDAAYQHGINIATTSMPLHEVMTQLSYLLEMGYITVYLPELRDPAIE